MKTECNGLRLDVKPHGRREVVAQFDGGLITSDAGGLLLREVESRLGIVKQFAGCFTDFRDEDLAEFSKQELLTQRITALALGYEDLNDHDAIRDDPLLALLVGREDLLGSDRLDPRDRGHALAGKSTLNRIELTPAGASEKSRYKKVVAHHRRIDDLLVDLFLQMETPTSDTPPTEIVLDVDATDDPLHGHQLGRFFQAYYKEYCYLPLYIFCGESLLCAKLRPSNIDASAGFVEQLARIVFRIRERWPDVRIIVRGDSGFCRERTMRWCEENNVDYLFGLAKNDRLKRALGKELEEAKQLFAATGEPARVFKDFTYRTRKSWSRARRVVGKAEHLRKGANPRFVVTSLPAEEVAARELYEQRYCARGRAPTEGWSGEPHQRTATDVVCRSYQHSHDAIESTSAVLFECGLHAVRGGSTIRFGGHAPGDGSVRYDPGASVENRRSHSRKCSQSLDITVGKLPVSGIVRACADEFA